MLFPDGRCADSSEDGQALVSALLAVELPFVRVPAAVVAMLRKYAVSRLEVFISLLVLAQV